MTREQVEALRNAGIPDKTIIDLIISETSAALAPDPEPAPAPADPEPEAPKPETAPEDPAKEDRILAAIEKLTGAIFAQNGRTLGRETEQENSVENILKHGFYDPEEVK